MKYEDPKPISKQSVEASLSRSGNVASEALIRAALTITDQVWVESVLVAALSDRRVEVRRAALLGFGHLARIHHQLDLGVIVPLVQRYIDDPDLVGTAAAGLEDITTFVCSSSDIQS